MQTSLTINGSKHSRDVAPATLLVELLRDELGLTGTHIGCDTSQCGACNVLIDGVAVKSCTVLAVQADGKAVTTIEGLATGPGAEGLHPMQAAFRDNHGLQCGFCTPGMVMAGIEIVRRHGPDVTAETIAHDLEGNLCRCTGYMNIVKAIEAGARAIGEADRKAGKGTAHA
jgi:carbon-monoxide dehydrogenase small subunit